ncbi:hypothetical protein CTI12_AA136570 [Artemisia annua]|uniref:Uncharacterized protein n=1 Tax=Artemisia annua TaxID=35608 RepID=A0A2U1PM54_ARTAN|nr:hypothetical protein CTI12_AA136570 [Artemisia annua]
MNNHPSSPNNVIDNIIILSSDTNSLSANDGSQEIVDNNVVSQAPIKSVGMGKGWFMHDNQQQQYPRINLEKLMQDDVWSNPNNAQVTTSPFRGIGEEKVWEKIRKPLSPKLHEGNHAFFCENTIAMLNAIKDNREQNHEMLKSLHDGVKMLQALASNMTCIVHNDRGDDSCDDNLVNHKN